MEHGAWGVGHRAKSEEQRTENREQRDEVRPLNVKCITLNAEKKSGFRYP
jgi:hypothetical protein